LAVELLGPLAEAAVPTPRTPEDRWLRALTDRWLLSLALANRAAAHRLNGSKPAAVSDLEQAETVANRILSENEDYTDAKFQLAVVWSLRAKWLVEDSSSLPTAEQACDKAIKILEELIRGSQLVPFYREQLAMTLTTRARARCLLGSNRNREALSDCKAALELAHGLIGAAPAQSAGNPHQLSLLARAYETKSIVHRQKGEEADSRSSLVSARDHLKQTLAIDNSRASDAELLAEIDKNLGDENSDRN
jgi:hypothetical protein